MQNSQTDIMIDAPAKELVGSGWIYEFLPFQRFTDMCLDVYFNDNHSEANFITVNAGLYSLFRDYIFHVSAQEKEAYTAHSILCRDNLETALSNLPLHLPATTDMILALVFGVCNPALIENTSANHVEGFLCYRAVEAVSVMDLDCKGIRAVPD